MIESATEELTKKQKKAITNKTYQQANKEAIAERQKTYYQSNKEVIVEKAKAYRQANKEVVAERKKAYYQSNKEVIAEKKKDYYQSNKEVIVEKAKANKEVLSEKKKAYYQSNKEVIAEKDKAYRQANKESIAEKAKAYRQANPIPQFIRGSLKRIFNNWQGGRAKAEKLHGYTYEQLSQRIESQFVDGMSWDNRNEWHIDHIKPLSLFIKEGVTEPSIINALSNLQPLWAFDNMSKGANYLY